MSARIETLAMALCAAQFPAVSAGYAWSTQFEDGKDEYRASARLAVHHLFNECECQCAANIDTGPSDDPWKEVYG